MTDNTSKIILKAKQLAETLVKSAGDILTENKGNASIVNYKDTQDILTNIDLKVESHIITSIEKAFPDHNIYSEEAGEINKSSHYTWVIDPLDGTKEFFRHIPLYCCAIMLEKDGLPLVSAVYDPELDELYSAGKHLGAFLNGQVIKVSNQTELAKSMLFTYLPRTAKEISQLSPIFDVAYRIRGHANHNMSYCWVAKGGYEGHFSLFTPQHWWDVAPGIFILQEAGGRVTDIEGNEVTHKTYKNEVLGTNGHIHAQLLSETQKLFK